MAINPKSDFSKKRANTEIFKRALSVVATVAREVHFTPAIVCFFRLNLDKFLMNLLDIQNSL